MYFQIEGVEDAGIYRLTDELAQVQTVDFFPPMVDDPSVFGQIAAANALNDVYAMGGKPITALNLVAFPQQGLDQAILQEILKGGRDILRKAEVSLAGGHSIADKEIKYGLAVTGLVHPGQNIRNNNLQSGGRIV